MIDACVMLSIRQMNRSLSADQLTDAGRNGQTD